MECPKCGFELDDKAMVCPNCKKVLKLACPVLAIGIKKNCVSDWEEGYMDEHATGNI